MRGVFVRHRALGPSRILRGLLAAGVTLSVSGCCSLRHWIARYDVAVRVVRLGTGEPVADADVRIGVLNAQGESSTPVISARTDADGWVRTTGSHFMGGKPAWIRIVRAEYLLVDQALRYEVRSNPLTKRYEVSGTFEMFRIPGLRVDRERQEAERIARIPHPELRLGGRVDEVKGMGLPWSKEGEEYSPWAMCGGVGQEHEVVIHAGERCFRIAGVVCTLGCQEDGKVFGVLLHHEGEKDLPKTVQWIREVCKQLGIHDDALEASLLEWSRGGEEVCERELKKSASGFDVAVILMPFPPFRSTVFLSLPGKGP